MNGRFDTEDRLMVASAWQPAGFRSLIDASLLEENVLGVGAGRVEASDDGEPAAVIPGTTTHLFRMTAPLSADSASRA